MNSIKTFAEAVVWSFSVKTVLRNFVKFTGKHLCQRLVFNNIAGLRPATLLKKRIWHRCFPVNFLKFLNTFFHRTPLVVASPFGYVTLEDLHLLIRYLEFFGRLSPIKHFQLGANCFSC